MGWKNYEPNPIYLSVKQTETRLMALTAIKLLSKLKTKTHLGGWQPLSRIVKVRRPLNEPLRALYTIDRHQKWTNL